MTWQEVLDDKSLEDLPYKIELNASGNIVMTRATNRHALYKATIVGELSRHKRGGHFLIGCSFETDDNVKVADVAWASDDFIKTQKLRTPFTTAPELCVEVVLPSRAKTVFKRKRDLYLAKGAKEVWMCDRSGNITFFNSSGALKKSTLFPRFPNKID